MLKKLLLSFLLIGTMLHAIDPAETVTRTSVTQLYFGTYDRAPNAAGLEYWVGTGLSNQEVSISFFDSDETKEKYPPEMTDGDFIDAVYMNVLRRTPSPEGKVWWEEQLSNGLSRPDFIMALLSTEGGDDEQVINNKTTVGLAFADDGRNDTDEAYAIMEHITADPRSVTATLCVYDLGECPTFVILVSPTNTFVEVGEQVEFNATAVFESGIKIDVTKKSEWASSDKDIAKVDEGIATGISLGSSTIIAIFSLNGVGGNTGSVGLDVVPKFPTFESLAIYGSDKVIAGITEQLYSVATLSNGKTYLVNDRVNWTSSNPAIATVNALGAVTGIVKGDVIITATAKNDSGVAATHNMTVTNDLVSIQVSPANTYVEIGDTQQFKATAIFTDGSTEDVTDSTTWNSSDAAIATVSANGIAVGISVGTVTIGGTYAVDGIEFTGAGSLDVLATPPTFVSLDINGADMVSIGLTDQLEAIATLSDGKTYNVNSNVTWTSSSSAIATVDAMGVVTGVALGDVTITATAKNDSSIVATHNMTVTDATLVSIQIEDGYYPDTPKPITTLDVDITTEHYITAWGIYSDGSRHYINTDTVWWSKDQQIASINFIQSSNVYGRDLGTTTVTAYYEGLEASITVNVVSADGDPTLIAITLKTNDGTDVTGGTIAPIPAGFETWVTAYGTYSDGSTENINRYAAYSSDKPEVAIVIDEIDSNIRGRSAGEAVITAEWQGISASVTAPVIGLDSIEIQEGCSSSETAVIDASNPLELTVGRLNAECINAWGNYADRSKIRITTSVLWGTEDRDIAKMDLLQRDSKVTGVAPGTTNATAKLVGIEGKGPVNVTAAP